MPFIVAIFAILHLVLLHQTSSSNELKISASIENRILFFPYFVVKDLFGVVLALFLYNKIVFFSPEIFNDSVNYVLANPLVTPVHIVPEWYFLPYYAVLRSILSKTVGIIALVCTILVFFLLPVIHPGSGKSSVFLETNRMFY